MVPITKAEKKELAKRFPNEHFPRTMKHRSKRGHYSCVESPELMEALEEIRHTMFKEVFSSGDQEHE